MFLIFLFLFSSTILLLRSFFILAGLWKGPILRSFEKYGDPENIYLPLLHTFIWFMLFIVSLLAVLFGDENATASMFSFLVLFSLILWNIYPRLKTFADNHPHIFMALPRWYVELRMRTSRDERRRLAYMWLRLPLSMQLHLSTNDHAFFHWADLVLISAVGYDYEE